MGEPMGQAFDHIAAANALRQTERFYHDCHSAYRSLIDAIRIHDFDPFDSADESSPSSIWDNGAVAHFYYIFRQAPDEPYRFFQLIIRPDTNILQQAGISYLHMCDGLGVSPDFPLVLVFGSFNVPGDLDGRFRGDKNIGRTWCRNVFRLQVLDNEFNVDGVGNGYTFNQEIVYHSNVPGNLWRCRGARFKIRSLAALVNDEAIAQLAGEIAAFPTYA